MTALVVFRRADESSVGPAAEMLDATPMSGDVRLKTRRPAGLFRSLQAEGRRRDVLVGRAASDGRVAAVGVRSEKDCHIDGRPEPACVGYLSSLRVGEDFRRGLTLGRGYRFLRELHEAGRAPFYLTTVLEDNRDALRLLASGRGGLPIYDDWGRVRTSLIDPRRAAARLRGESGEVRVDAMEESDLEAVLDFLRTHGPRRQFFPSYRPADFFSENGLLPGLAKSDMLLARDRNGLAGCAGVWDQSEFKSWEVAGYGMPLRAFRRAYNLWARWKGVPSWPAPGKSLNLRFISLFCVKDDDPRVGRGLLRAAAELARRHRADALAWSLHERDPLQALLGPVPRITLESRLFVVYWPQDQAGLKLPDRRLVPYLETGSL